MKWMLIYKQVVRAVKRGEFTNVRPNGVVGWTDFTCMGMTVTVTKDTAHIIPPGYTFDDRLFYTPARRLRKAFAKAAHERGHKIKEPVADTAYRMILETKAHQTTIAAERKVQEAARKKEAKVKVTKGKNRSQYAPKGKR